MNYHSHTKNQLYFSILLFIYWTFGNPEIWLVVSISGNTLISRISPDVACGVESQVMSCFRLLFRKIKCKSLQKNIQNFLFWGLFYQMWAKMSFLKKKNTHCQLLGFYKTWNLGWKVKYHNNSTFILLFEKLKDRISKRKHKICPNINKNEFFAITSLFQFLDRTII